MSERIRYQLPVIRQTLFYRLCSAFTLFMMMGLAGCIGEAGTPTPTRELSGPTLIPSATFAPPPISNEVENGEYIGMSDPTAAALAPFSELPPLAVPGNDPLSAKQSVVVTADDGTQLAGDLYISGSERLPGVLMLARGRGDWGDFPAQVHAAGFTVLVMDVRENAPPEDVRAMLQSLSSGTALPDRLAVVGADVGADLGLLGCALEDLCDAVAILSPTGDVDFSNAMIQYNPRPMFLTATETDEPSFGAISTLQTLARGEVFFQPLQDAGHGTALVFNRPDLGNLLIAWLQQQLQ